MADVAYSLSDEEIEALAKDIRGLAIPISLSRPKVGGRHQGYGSGTFTRACPRRPSEHGSRNGSGYFCEPAIGILVFAKQALANGLFNERERFLGLARFDFSNFGAKLYSRQLILLVFNRRPSLF